MKNNKNIHYFWRLLLHVQQLSSTDQQGGYAMLMTSIVAILIFSMLSVYLFSANLYKSVASSIVDSGTTFYAAEYGLNQRAYSVRQKFDDYGSPNVSLLADPNITPAQQMQACIDSRPVANAFTNDDSECRLKITDYKEAMLKAVGGSSGMGMNESYRDNANIRYNTYSFVRDITNYEDIASKQVATSKIPVGDDYAGLNTLEYRYRVYTTAAKEVNDGTNPKPISAQTMLQMDFNNRLIPLFQFAIYYEKDLEIANGPNFTITGPVHTNSNLYLSPDGSTLAFNGNVTSVGSIYKSLKFATRSPGTISFVGGTNVASVSTAGTLMTPTDIDNSIRLKANQRSLKLPPTNFLTRSGEYYENADMRVDFAPGNANPIRIRALGQDLSSAATRSLMQPVLVRIQAHGSDGGLAERTRLCSKTTLTDRNEPTTTAEAIPALSAGLTGLALTNDQKVAVVNALQRALVNPTSPILAYSGIQAAATGTLLANLDTELNALSGLGSGATRTNIINTVRASRLDQIAALQPTIPAQNLYGACLVPAPMQILLKRDRREQRNINILQSSIKSLAIWNRDGAYWEGSVWTPAANLLFPRTAGVPSTAMPSALPTATVPVKATSFCDYDCMGLGSNDTTQGGLVWHFSIDRTNPAYAYTSGNGVARGGNSVYGFAFTEGRRLPGALTIATDQSAYLQGDFNNPSRLVGDLDEAALGVGFQTTNSPAREKRPSAVLADTVHILSNGCSNTDRQISCMRNAGASDANSAKDAASNTAIRAGFLFKTDQATATQPSGQLENSLRFLESWSGDTLLYRGSLISLGIPTEYQGIWNSSNYYDAPTRNWGFDNDFNSSIGLPPMTPRVAYLKQKVFRRDYDMKDRSYNPATSTY